MCIELAWIWGLFSQMPGEWEDPAFCFACIFDTSYTGGLNLCGSDTQFCDPGQNNGALHWDLWSLTEKSRVLLSVREKVHCKE